MSENTLTRTGEYRSERYVIAMVGIVAASFAPAVAWGPLAILATAFFITVGVLAINSAVGASRRTACSSNMLDIWVAVDAYHSRYGELPPPYTIDAQGNPLHSWRVLILPFLGEQELYDVIDLNDPWHDPANLALGDRMPGVFGCAEHRHHEGKSPTTTYVAVVGDGRTAFLSAEFSLEDLKSFLLIDDGKPPFD